MKVLIAGGSGFLGTNLKNALDVRHAAAGALVRVAQPEHRSALQALARDYPDISTRKLLLEASEAAGKTTNLAQSK